MNFHVIKGRLTSVDNKRVWEWLRSADNTYEKINIENEPQEGIVVKLTDGEYYISAIQHEIISDHYNLPKGDKFCAVIKKSAYIKGDYVRDVKDNKLCITQTYYSN